MRARRPSGRRDTDKKVREPSGAQDETRVFDRTDMRKPRRNWVRIAVYSVLALLLFAAGLAYGALRWARGIDVLDMELGADLTGRINILVLGVDAGVNGARTQEWTRSDVNMVVSIDPITKDAAMLSIPRDTRVFVPGKIASYTKMGHAHAYGGPQLTIETIEGFLGIDIDYYVRVDFEAFKRAVDVFGGVDFDVPQDMKYEDPYQDLVIDIPAGPNHLNGEIALGLVRYRTYPDADIGRIKMQESFLKVLMKKAVSLSGILKVKQLYDEVNPYLKTDLTYEGIMQLANMASSINPDDVKMGMIPGSDRYITEDGVELSYWIPDAELTGKMVDEMIKGISRERNAAVRIAIENGNDMAGAADALATILRDMGFQVVSVEDDGGQEYAETRVIAGSSDSLAQALALRSVKPMCPDAKAYTSKSVPEDTDVLIMIGRDFRRPSQ